MFSFEGFIVLTLLFSFLIHFEFIFVSCERWDLECILLQMEICWEANLSSLSGLGTLVKNQLTIDVWVYFSTIKSILLVYSLSYVNPRVLGNSFVSFEIRKCESYNFVLFQGCLGFWGPLLFRINLESVFPILKERPLGFW